MNPPAQATPDRQAVGASTPARVNAQAQAVQVAFDEPEQAVSILNRDFLVFDTAAHGGGADDKVSREDVEAMARGGTLANGTVVTAEQQAAAEYLFDNPEVFTTLDIADDGGGSPDDIISRNDVDAAVAAGPEIYSEIDDGQVEHFLNTIRADIPLNQSALAEALRNPLLNEAERNLILQTLARGDESELLAFYANDAWRFREEDYAALTEDQRTIADAVQKAYDAGAINADDLLRIADANGASNGAQRFMSILRQSSEARQPGGVAEVLADALWQRNGNDGMDRAVAAIHYTSDPTLMAQNLDTADKRAAAFEALVQFNEQAPYQDIPAGPTATMWEHSALAAAGRLFTAHSQELVDRYTNAQPGQAVRTETLAQFLGQTVFNPEAKGIVLDRTRDLVPAVVDAIDRVGDTLFERARDPEASASDQSRAMRQLGQLTASIGGGAALALTRYDEQILAHEASRKEFAGLVGKLVGKLPLGDVGKEIADQVTGPLAERIYDAITDQPERPDAALAGVIYDSIYGQVDLLGEEIGNANLVTAFEAGFAAELQNLQLNLNVNLGGHR
ncbi:MAG: hypothetical protein ACRD2Z_10580 [Thermoanaerobaculia bacterium]